MAKSIGDLRIGISGWTYTPWRGHFYPEGLVQKRELEYAASKLSSIEINGSFYSLQSPKSYRAWYDATPDDFIFSLKGSRFITHMRRLLNVKEPLANFFASGILDLKEKLGPILWQFPENFKFDPDRFEQFFNLLPRDTQAAARLAKQFTLKRKGGVSTKALIDRPIRHAIEIRNDSFKSKDFITLLRRHHIALVFADAPMHWPYLEDLTADFVYLRLHGELELYASGYDPEALRCWAEKIRLWQSGRQPQSGPRMLDRAPPKRSKRDVFIYFDNDKKVHAPFNAIDLAQMLGQDWGAGHNKDFSRPSRAKRAG